MLILHAQGFYCGYSLSLIGLAGEHNYAVQIDPVEFLVSPQPPVLITHIHSTLLLNCQARLSHIINKDVPLPVISWRHNGSLISPTHSRILVTNTTGGRYSQLFINDVMDSDSGQYECVANDANNRYITVSDPTHVTVLPLKSKY